MNVELPSRTELHLDAKLQNEVNAHFDSKISEHERDVEIPNRDIHNDSKFERKNEEIRAEPRLSKYVKRHRTTTQIIGDKDARLMTRNRLRSESCLLNTKETKLVKDALENKDWSKAMEDEIEQIEKNKTWTLVLDQKTRM